MRNGRSRYCLAQTVENGSRTSSHRSKWRSRGLAKIRCSNREVNRWDLVRGRKSELEFFSDGRIEEFPAELVPSKGEAASTKVKFHGRWSIDSRLGPPILDIEAAGVGSLRGLPVIQRDEGSPAVRFSIDRLDDSFLRLTELGNARSAAFYRRADKHDAEPKFDASLPPKLRQMFLLARLAPDEALALRNWLGPDREGDIELIRFEALEKLDKARHGTLDFAELFGLEKDEAAAFRELYKQTLQNCAGSH